MKINEKPLETVSKLCGSKVLDVDPDQSNRYCILLNSQRGKSAYYFTTPIYNIDTRKLVRRHFVETGGCYQFIGSSSSVQVTNTHIKMMDHGKVLVLNFDRSVNFKLDNGELISDSLKLVPTFNGVLIDGYLDHMNFDVSLNFAYQNIRSSQNCIAFMEENFKPALTVSALYCYNTPNDCRPAILKCGGGDVKKCSIRVSSDNSLYRRGVMEINFYEPKLIQDTPVSGKIPNENNAFGGIAFIGKSDLYGTQWLYSRLDLRKMPELDFKYICKMKLYVPMYNKTWTEPRMFGLSNRFCSFGSNWNNKVQKGIIKNRVSKTQDYLCIDLFDTYVKRYQLKASEGMVLTPLANSDIGYQVIATGDNYTTPPILYVEYVDR